MSNLTLAQWLSKFEEARVELGLARVLSVCKKLELNKFTIPIITVAGTNGKGSTVAAIKAIYVAAGYNIGTYTSPHIKSVNERICINNEMISDYSLCAAFSLISSVATETLTYFEMLTLAALWYFKNNALDLIVLEVGLGGRLDATNVVDSTLAIITTIDFDHQEYLGNTREKIGYEKAGIMRQQQLVVVADFNPPQIILQKADALQSSLFLLGRDYFFEENKDNFIFKYGNAKVLHLPKSALHPQAIAAAIMAATCLEKVLPTDNESLKLAMQQVSIVGRQQLIAGEVNVLLDVSHNAQAAMSLALKIATINSRKVHIVFSALKDKDLCGLIMPMQDCADYWYVAELNSKRAANIFLLQESFAKVSTREPTYFSSINKAYYNAMQNAQKGDLIVVYGSFLTIGEVLQENINEFYHG